MEKSWRIYTRAWGVFIVAAIVIALVAIIVPSHHDRAEDPYAIEKIVKVDLPEFEFVRSDDNCDRVTSRWDVYTHYHGFSEPLSEESIKKMERLCQTDSLHWRKDAEGDSFFYSAEGGIDGLYTIKCEISNDYSCITYTVDESEGILLAFPFLLCAYLLLLWGIVLIVIGVVRNIKR